MSEDLFYLDYSRHPRYGKEFGKPSLKTKLFKALSVAPVVLKVALPLLLKRKKPCYQNGLECPQALKEFFQNGVIAVSDESIKSIFCDKLNNKIDNLKAKVRSIKDTKRKFADCIEPFSFSEEPALINELNEAIMANEVLAWHLQFFLGAEARLFHVNIHFNQSSDVRVFKHEASDECDPRINFFHVDTNTNSLKLMIYLSDSVSIDNGAFQYVPGSHRYYSKAVFGKRKVVRNTQLFERDYDTRKQFWSLPRLLQYKNEFSDFGSDTQLGQYIIKKSRTYTSPKNVILFDPLGIHRGGCVSKGERLACQLVFALNDHDWRL